MLSAKNQREKPEICCFSFILQDLRASHPLLSNINFSVQVTSLNIFKEDILVFTDRVQALLPGFPPGGLFRRSSTTTQPLFALPNKLHHHTSAHFRPPTRPNYHKETRLCPDQRNQPTKTLILSPGHSPEELRLIRYDNLTL